MPNDHKVRTVFGTFGKSISFRICQFNFALFCGQIELVLDIFLFVSIIYKNNMALQKYLSLYRFLSLMQKKEVFLAGFRKLDEVLILSVNGPRVSRVF